MISVVSIKLFVLISLFSCRCFLPAAGNSVARVQFPVCPIQRRQPPAQQVNKTNPFYCACCYCCHEYSSLLCTFLYQVSGRKWAGSGTGGTDGQPCSSTSCTTTEEERGDLGPDRGSGETESKRMRLDGSVIILHPVFNPDTSAEPQCCWCPQSRQFFNIHI